MEVRTQARLQMLGAALLFSTGGAAIKACQLSGWQVAAFRSAFGALTLWILLPGARRGWNRRTVLVASAYAATLLLYVLANKLTLASNAIFLQSTAPLYLLLIAPLLLRERIRRRDLVFMAALGVGLALFFVGTEAPRRTAPDPVLGNVLGAISAVAWALTVAGLRWLARAETAPGRSSSGSAAGAALLGNLLVFAVAAPFAFPVTHSVPADWALVVFLGVCQIGLAYVLMTAGMRRVRALEGALLLLVEPVLNTGWAWIFHGEVPGAWSRMGALLILSATVWHAVRATRAGAERRRVSAPQT